MNAAIILYAIMLALVLYSNGKQKNLNKYLNKLGFARRTNLSRETINTILVLGIMLITTIILGIIFSQVGLGDDLTKVSEIVSKVNLVEVLIIIGLAAFIEEIFFRAYLQPKTNIWVASFIFAFFHIVYGSLSEILGAFILGAILGKTYQKTKNIFTPILAHYLYDIVSVIAIFTVGAA